MATQGHNSVSHAFCRALKLLGYVADVYEVPMGLDEEWKQVYADGLGKNFDVEAGVLVWDTRVTSSYLRGYRKTAAKSMNVVTDAAEKLKRLQKEPSCSRCLQGRARFLPVICNSHGGIGREAWNFLRDGFKRKSDKAPTPPAKQRVAMQLMNSVAEIACAVLRRNSMMMAANASPIAGEYVRQWISGDVTGADEADLTMDDVRDMAT